VKKIAKRKVVFTEYPHLKEFGLFLDELNSETERGAVLVSCSYLEELLRKTIVSFLADKKAAETLLEGFNAPLGTFSARIIAAYSMGLISKSEYDECNLLRKVRNEFAHNTFMSFESGKIKDLCALLNFAGKDYGDVKVDARGRYTMSAVALILNFTNRPHYVSKEKLSHKDWPY
jgi:hypothetical protein